MAGGKYLLTFTYTSTLSPTILTILVPVSGGPYSLDEVIIDTPTTPIYSTTGSGSPEGVISGNPGSIYTDTTNGALWIKMSNTDATGWQRFVQL